MNEREETDVLEENEVLEEDVVEEQYVLQEEDDCTRRNTGRRRDGKMAEEETYWKKTKY